MKLTSAKDIFFYFYNRDKSLFSFAQVNDEEEASEETEESSNEETEESSNEESQNSESEDSEKDDKDHKQHGYQSPIKSSYIVTGNFGAGDARHKAGKHETAGGHDGVDLMADKGTAIYAMACGTVKSVGFDSDSGNFITILHANGTEESTYRHMSNASPLKAGDEVCVLENAEIGSVGDTGSARGTCPHLHLEVRRGSLIDPRSISELNIPAYSNELVEYATHNKCQIKPTDSNYSNDKIASILNKIFKTKP